MHKLVLLFLILFSTSAFGQQFKEELDPFNKLIVDPYIDVELVKGDTERIEFFYDNISADEIFVEQHGRTLRLYLADARIGFRFFDNDFDINRKYRYAKVKAVITYKSIKNIQFRGEQKLTCKDELSGNRVKLKAYGETQVEIANINVDNLKIALFGENKLTVSTGQTYHQTINTYGENKVDAKNVLSYGVKTNSFGENRVSVNASEYLRVLHLGEGELRYSGKPAIERRIVIGEVDMRQSR